MGRTVSDTLLYWLWLQRAVGPGSAHVPKLLETFDGVRKIYEADREAYCAAGVLGRALDALCNKSLDEARKTAERCMKLGWILTPDDELYPAPLRHLFSPPLALYGIGTLPSFSNREKPVMTIVGTRESTEYGNAAAGAMAAGLAAAGCPIVSGGARGIDRAAHEGALYAGGHTIVVQACGLDVNYPRLNRNLRRRVVENGGAVITEFTPGVLAYKPNFHIRNRLISGLSIATCVIEAPGGSGALITAHAAMEQGRDVFVLPGRATDATSDGSHALIREGAALVTMPSQILQEYPDRFGETLEKEADRAHAAYYDWLTNGMPKPKKVSDGGWTEPEPTGEPVPCPDFVKGTARRIYDTLSGKPPLSVEMLCEYLSLEPGEIFAALTELELYGCAEVVAGKRYTITRKDS